jgi:hypothetical protein
MPVAMSYPSATFEFALVASHREDPHAAARRVEQAKVDEFVANHKTWLPKAAENIARYQMYVDKLAERLPGSYDRLQRFLESGSCTCCSSPKKQTILCTCADEGGKCTCEINDWKDKQNVCHACSNPRGGLHDCETTQIDDVVRIYEIYPEEDTWKDFLHIYEYAVSKDERFVALQEQLENPIFEAEDKDNEHDEHYSGGDIPGSPCRIITISHLSPNVAKLLGSKFKISADFFNRHLPGTEAISGRLISRLPSAVQIDLDELYESHNTFEDIWDTNDPLRYGHYVINKAIGEHFRFPVGWDYFPISKEDFEDSKNNVSMKSGYEVLLRDSAEGEIKNLFQFNLNHRISVYANPPNHPRTGKGSIPFCPSYVNLAVIIIFYPTLPIHLFAFPLYSMVSAYWARLVIRRSFDLDLLEWRSKDRLTSNTIEETKSRRVAITRHQRNITTSLWTLRSLMLAEKGCDPATRELAPSWNMAHANGLVPEHADEDSWQTCLRRFC